MQVPLRVETDLSSLKLGIAVSKYHGWATDCLLEGAIQRWRVLGGSMDRLLVMQTPGTWELTAVIAAMAEQKKIDAAVALGVVIRGETPHFNYICQGVMRGLTDVTTVTGIPVGLGVLTCDTPEQARARSGGESGNKGAEAVTAAVEAALAIRAVRSFEFSGD